MGTSGARLTLDVVKPAAGGRMLARHDGQVILVSGAIPGERVVALVERVGKGVSFADVVEVLAPSADRRPAAADWRCGGQVLSHIAYPRQLALKGEIVADAFGRIARLPLANPPTMLGSPEHGYRMRARMHVREGRLGFYREGTHEVCDVAPSGQLLPETAAWVSDVPRRLTAAHLAGLTDIEVAESVDGGQRVCHLTLGPGATPSLYEPLAEGLTGLIAQPPERGAPAVVWGCGTIVERFGGDAVAGPPPLELTRHPRSFFQGNRFLLAPLVRRVLEAVGDGPLLDLYAGVGLFGLSATAAGMGLVTLVEGDPQSASDLEVNAAPWRPTARAMRQDVESFLASRAPAGRVNTVIVDPPRTGLSREATAGLCRLGSPVVVYVSCDVATLARDARALIDGGYGLDTLLGLDLFPNTAHVESVAVFRRQA